MSFYQQNPVQFVWAQTLLRLSVFAVLFSVVLIGLVRIVNSQSSDTPETANLAYLLYETESCTTPICPQRIAILRDEQQHIWRLPVAPLPGSLTWSPNGEQLAFLSRIPHDNAVADLHLVDADGANLTVLVNQVARFRPVWSPDGEKIAFVADYTGNNDIYVTDLNGSYHGLTDNPALDWSPRWSPDGEKIAFVSNRDGNHEIYVMNADGGNQTNLSQHPERDEQPDWSPDGERIAFVSTRDQHLNGYGLSSAQAYVMSSDGTDPQRLGLFKHNAYQPQWSPAGDLLVFYLIEVNGSVIWGNLYLADAARGRVLPFTRFFVDTPPNVGAYDWSPDGRALTFAVTPRSAGQICLRAIGQGGDAVSGRWHGRHAEGLPHLATGLNPAHSAVRFLHAFDPIIARGYNLRQCMRCVDRK